MCGTCKLITPESDITKTINLRNYKYYLEYDGLDDFNTLKHVLLQCCSRQ